MNHRAIICFSVALSLLAADPSWAATPAAPRNLRFSGASVIPAPPTNVTAVAGNAQVLLGWTAGAGATTYHVKRGAASGGPYTIVGTPGAPSYTDTGLANGTKYYYVVTSVNSYGESGNSSEVSATPAIPPALSIPASHPRLWFNASRLAQAKTWLAANPSYPRPTDDTSSDYYTDIAWRHIVHGDDCSVAINYTMNYVIDYSPSNNGSDTARNGGEMAAEVYDWCYDQMTAQQRAAFFNNIGGTGAGWNDYLTGINQQAWGSPAMVQDNYNIGNMRNDIEIGIATYWENQAKDDGFLIDGITTRWTDNFVPSVGGKSAGGVGQEGDEYAASLAQYLIIPFVTMDLEGRDIFNETGYFKQQAIWLVYETTPSPTPNGSAPAAFQLNPFSDDEHFVTGGAFPRNTYFTSFMNMASNYWSAINVGKYARHWVNTVAADPTTKATPAYILAQDNAPSDLPYTGLPLDYYGAGIQYMYGRKAWDTSSCYFLWQLGIGTAGVGHGHTDVGNFNIWRGGRWLSRETTGYADTITGYGYKNFANDDTGGILAHNSIVFGTKGKASIMGCWIKGEKRTKKPPA